MPVYGHCWTQAISNLQSSCRKLTDHVQKSMAFQFTQCFLGKSDAEKVVCLPNQDLTACAQNQSANFFHSYLEFFTHTQSICFYLSSEQWQKKAEKQVVRLLDASVVVSGHLEEAQVVQTKLLDQEKQALGNAGEVRMWIATVMDRITHLQNVFIDEFTGFYSLMFYFVMTALCFVLTATQRTAGARFWVFLLLIATFFVERFWNKTKLEHFATLIGESPSTDALNRMLSDDAWMIRKIFCAMASALIMYFAFTYVDINAVNTQMIKELHGLMLERLTSAPATLEPVDEKDGPCTTMNRGDRAGSLVSMRKSPASFLDTILSADIGGSAESSPEEVDSGTCGFLDRMRRSLTPSRNFTSSPRRQGNNLATIHENGELHNGHRETSGNARIVGSGRASISRQGSRATTPVPASIAPRSCPTSPAHLNGLRIFFIMAILIVIPGAHALPGLGSLEIAWSVLRPFSWLLRGLWWIVKFFGDTLNSYESPIALGAAVGSFIGTVWGEMLKCVSISEEPEEFWSWSMFTEPCRRLIVFGLLLLGACSLVFFCHSLRYNYPSLRKQDIVMRGLELQMRGRELDLRERDLVIRERELRLREIAAGVTD